MLEHNVAKIDIQIINHMFVLLVNFFEFNIKDTYIMLAI